MELVLEVNEMKKKKNSSTSSLFCSPLHRCVYSAHWNNEEEDSSLYFKLKMKEKVEKKWLDYGTVAVFSYKFNFFPLISGCRACSLAYKTYLINNAYILDCDKNYYFLTFSNLHKSFFENKENKKNWNVIATWQQQKKYQQGDEVIKK